MIAEYNSSSLNTQVYKKNWSQCSQKTYKEWTHIK